jgi:hypothetical protein
MTEKELPDPNVRETGLLASPWFWRAVWVFIGLLMLLLLLYEFLWLE